MLKGLAEEDEDERHPTLELKTDDNHRYCADEDDCTRLSALTAFKSINTNQHNHETSRDAIVPHCPCCRPRTHASGRGQLHPRLPPVIRRPTRRTEKMCKPLRILWPNMLRAGRVLLHRRQQPGAVRGRSRTNPGQQRRRLAIHDYHICHDRSSDSHHHSKLASCCNNTTIL